LSLFSSIPHRFVKPSYMDWFYPRSPHPSIFLSGPFLTITRLIHTNVLYRSTGVHCSRVGLIGSECSLVYVFFNGQTFQSPLFNYYATFSFNLPPLSSSFTCTPYYCSRGANPCDVHSSSGFPSRSVTVLVSQALGACLLAACQLGSLSVAWS
jgi:hypothetical protein